ASPSPYASLSPSAKGAVSFLAYALRVAEAPRRIIAMLSKLCCRSGTGQGRIAGELPTEAAPAEGQSGQKRGGPPLETHVSGNGRGPWFNAGTSPMNLVLPNDTVTTMGLVSLFREHRRLASAV